MSYRKDKIRKSIIGLPVEAGASEDAAAKVLDKKITSANQKNRELSKALMTDLVVRGESSVVSPDYQKKAAKSLDRALGATYKQNARFAKQVKPGVPSENEEAKPNPLQRTLRR